MEHMKDSHGFEKVGYVPIKKSENINLKKFSERIITFIVLAIFIGIAFLLFIYPGYFIGLFSEAGYKLIN